jgi:mRNA interferase MazF
VKRGDIWTVAGAADYSGKPRPAVIVQDDRFSATASVIVCPFTSNPVAAADFRLPVAPSAANGLGRPSRLMADKLTSVARRKLGTRVGRLGDDDLDRLERAVLIFLGLAR